MSAWLAHETAIDYGGGATTGVIANLTCGSMVD